MNTLTAAERCAELIENGLEKKKVMATLTLEDYPAGEINACFPKVVKKSFREDYYDYLVEMTPSAEDAREWMLAYDGLTNNMRKSIPAFLRDAELVRRVRVKAAIEAAIEDAEEDGDYEEREANEDADYAELD